MLRQLFDDLGLARRLKLQWRQPLSDLLHPFRHSRFPFRPTLLEAMPALSIKTCVFGMGGAGDSIQPKGAKLVPVYFRDHARGFPFRDNLLVQRATSDFRSQRKF